MAVVALISILAGALIASIIQYQLKSYNDIFNDKLETLENKFAKQLNQVQDQIEKLQEQELKLANALATLARTTSNLASRQQRFENFIFSFNRQLLEQQIITTRRSIENRKLIMNQNAYETQRDIEEYNARKLILQALKNLRNIPALRNDTMYRNQIRRGIIINTEIYRIVRQNANNYTQWNKEHPLIIRDRSNRQRNFENMFRQHQNQFDTSQYIKQLNDISEITINPIPIYKFTNNYVPI